MSYYGFDTIRYYVGRDVAELVNLTSPQAVIARTYSTGELDKAARAADSCVDSDFDGVEVPWTYDYVKASVILSEHDPDAYAEWRDARYIHEVNPMEWDEDGVGVDWEAIDEEEENEW